MKIAVVVRRDRSEGDNWYWGQRPKRAGGRDGRTKVGGAANEDDEG